MVETLSRLADRVYTALLPTTDPYAPHRDVNMEGYYTHLHVPSTNASDAPPLTLVIIFCEVNTATDPSKRIMVYVLYAPHHNLSHNPVDPESEGEPDFSKGFVREMCAPGWKLSHPRSEGSGSGSSSSSSMHTTGAVEPWGVEVPGIGYMKTDANGSQHFLVRMPVNPSSTPISASANADKQEEELILTVNTAHRTPWSSTSPISGPEGPFERLGALLPLHWHVFSGCSKAEWKLERRRTQNAVSVDPLIDAKAGLGSREVMASGIAMAHIEKNHGVGFPSGWLWAHCLGPSSSSAASIPNGTDTTYDRPPIRFALAGGSILGIEAYLVGFRDDNVGIEWDFFPPLTVGMRGRGKGFGMKVERRWDAEVDENAKGRGEVRSVRVQVWTTTRWLDVEIVARADSFISLPGPVPSGFAPDLCHESFTAQFNITLYERPPSLTAFLEPSSDWKKIGSYVIEEGALEFGGEYAKATEQTSRSTRTDSHDGRRQRNGSAKVRAD